ncbi:YsnF/AvaK domain-containing protein [Rufibacter sediminis]|uniref:YsnF/AvaK domain-containing protein n=1 Tax=Rufibacter sediminis TaxID=2762756 RepID=A0ABR6VVC3_9BACT|nr:YsnF/AvaK domain-containing protein [Rufibacter sediminis]MBC3541135.1 YsnF/AvaK domain-containing protein [Rufibacter sediminis]
MAQTVIGIFDSSSDAQRAVQELKSLGINDDRIDVSSASSSSSSSSTSYGSGTTTSDSTYGSTTSSTRDHDHNDGIGGFFRSLFSDDDDSATTYSNVARHSDCIVTVHAQTDEEARRAAIILDQYGSVDVDQRATEYGYRSGTTGSYAAGADTTYTGTTTNTSLADNSLTDNSLTDRTTDIRDTTDSTSIPIIEENLQVGKREIETGGARLRSRIVERPVEEHLRLRSEHVRVERRAVDRPASDADFNSFREGDIELTEHAEVPVVNKEARVVEEVSLGKEVEERDEVIRDTVRSTEVDVDNLNTGTNRTSLDTDSDLDRDRDRTGRTGLDLDNDRSTAI